MLYTSVSQALGRGPVPGPGINYTGPSSHRKKNLLGRGLTKVEKHCSTLHEQVEDDMKESSVISKNFSHMAKVQPFKAQC
jgi:hypothetical protein